MKLLKLELGNLPKDLQFRSLHAGFKVDFHHLDDNGATIMESFSPFCFAGLNGSGKSNVLECLAAIFFHLECCVAKFKPKSFEKYFRPEECIPDAFTLEYLIGPSTYISYTLSNLEKITIEKEQGKAPKMFRQPFPFYGNEGKIPVSIEPKISIENPQPAEGKRYIPDNLVGYSSGENEILSLPFIKSRLINFDKYTEDFKKNYKYEEPENSLIYIDSKMSQAVLLVCLLYEDERTLAPLKNELGIVGLRSFRINLNVQTFDKNVERKSSNTIVKHIEELINSLKKCASCWFEHKIDDNDQNNNLNSILSLDFFVNNETKKAFKEHFKTSFELFRFLQVLYELNSNIILNDTKEEVYKSKGLHTDGKLPEGSPSQNVFYFLDFFILKEIHGETEPKELLLREFSDGEHQFLHTMGICLMLKDRRCLLLLDEPETHFNPGWRAKFIKILNDSINASESNNLLKDLYITSHSPFIISDCKSSNVIVFHKNKETNRIEAHSAAKLDIHTFGNSIDIISDEIFNYKQSIGEYSNEVIESINFDNIKTENDVIKIKKQISILGDSIEKDLVLARLNQVILSIRR